MVLIFDPAVHHPITPGDPTPQPPGVPAPEPTAPPTPQGPPPVRAFSAQPITLAAMLRTEA